MKYFSTRQQSNGVTFKKAIYKGLPEDNGLYMPEEIPELSASFLEKMQDMDIGELGFHVIQPYVGDEITPEALREIIDESLDFEIPLKRISEKIYSLELYHGPTFAFKDVGARFLARCLSYFHKDEDRPLTVLVATSGDTGSAVAQGFFKVPNIEVVILYPSGKISAFQEQQMTTLGHNITALEVDGTFDDCQYLVKQAFLDEELREKLLLTSANSINVARLIPQSIYYFHAMAQLPADQKGNTVFSVPSGNYGNLTAGLIASRMGLPVPHFIACSNINDTVPRYLTSGNYESRSSRQTISNAMDVGDPSNFKRMLHLFEDSHPRMAEALSGYAYSDEETLKAISEVYQQYGYIMDPHGAIGYLGLRAYQQKYDRPGIFLETAHPYKFKESVESVIPKTLSPLIDLEEQPKQSIPFKKTFETFKEWLISRQP